MRCAVDTNVLVDVLQADPVHGVRSAARIQMAVRSLALFVPPFVYCELLVAGRAARDLQEAFSRARMVLEEEVPLGVYEVAAARCRQYTAARRTAGGTVECPACGLRQTPVCASCGRPLSARRLPFDFLIGAFAAAAADRHLLTRDAGTYRRYFPEVVLV